MKLLVDSAARDRTLSATNALASDIYYNYTLTEESGQVRCLKLSTCLVPRSFYAVVSGWSSVFEYIEGASTYRSVTIPEGTYDGATLATTLSALLTASTAGFTCTYSDVTNKLTFVNATGGDITIPDQVNGESTAFPEPGVNTVLGLYDGGEAGVVYAAPVISTGSSYEAPNMVDMSQPAFLFVEVSSGSANNSKGIRDWYTRRQFMITFGDTPYLGIKEQPMNAQFEQCDKVDGQIMKRLLIQWRTGIPDRVVQNSASAQQTQRYTLSFNGVHHQLLFQVL